MYEYEFIDLIKFSGFLIMYLSIVIGFFGLVKSVIMGIDLLTRA
ncbi:hypothetical protein LMG7974_00213 [Campylobacter majalis]|uniref:Uncharacterized protein n=1 Tax=Campylobacter majalis TaxID=2790656 RepID=A0ABM8Q356_9BACT|nr:hypothetical protein LMG7974_00213 [Campylobacter majalis]